MEINGGPVFLGGLTTESSLSLGDSQLNLTSFTSLMNKLNGFNGCIQNLKIGNHEVNFEVDASMIFNAKPCRPKSQDIENVLDNEMDEKILLETMEGFDEDAYLERMNRN